jgi:copper transport protein
MVQGARTIAAILVAAALNILLAVAAQAHATLVSSDPADGAVIPAAPSWSVLTFNEPVSPLVLRLVAPDGASVPITASIERESSLVASLPVGLHHGTYALSWRVVSLDGHPVGGTVVFSVGAASAAPSVFARSALNSTVAGALWALKVVFYTGLFFGIGGSFFLAWIAPGVGSGRTMVSGALVCGLVATVALIGLQGADALELPLAGLASGETWRVGFETSFGMTAVVAMSAGLLAKGRHARRLSFLGMTIAGISLALSGHASTAVPQWLTRPAVFVHTTSVLFWVGSLAPLAMIMRGEAHEDVLARFSKIIPWAVTALVLSGLVLAIIQVANPAALILTSYGRVLAAKLAMVAFILALAAWNRFRLTSPDMSRAPGAGRRLARSIVVETAAVLVILGLVAGWRFTPPPRSLAVASLKTLARSYSHQSRDGVCHVIVRTGGRDTSGRRADVRRFRNARRQGGALDDRKQIGRHRGNLPGGGQNS